MAVDELRNVPKVIGIKQTTKALLKDEAAVLYIAKDAESRVTEPLENLAKEKGVQIIKVPSMKELGKAFGIEVGAATAAILVQK
ncbi:MAG: hypothetical protein JM58_09875 [Peptococcaceae bacterium BICA1-8]|nr:MAG: hypothetical protein JM58_09875 [Peptococcaceae bacterium BICA1-8]